MERKEKGQRERRIMERRKLVTGMAVVALCGAVGVGGGLLGCAPQGSSSEAPSNDGGATEAQATTSDADKTMEEWGELYPLQYGSYHQSTVKDDGLLHGHYDLKQKLLAPAKRVERTDGQLDTKLINESGGFNQDESILVSGVEWDSENHVWVVKDSELDDLSGTRERQGCYACKTSVFDDVYDQDGAGIFGAKMTDEFVDTLNGHVWNCTTCHDGDPAANPPDAQLTYWTQLARDSYDLFDSDERVCGQCHNSFDYRSHITDQETMDGFSPYRYGLDVDSLYEAAVEDGIYSIDEDTGILLTCFDHPEIEFVQGSAMNELGVTCVDCHMPQADESGEGYTNHNASGSPLENEDALEYCLTCHKEQGIESTADMKAMVEDLQAKTKAVEEDLDARFDQAYELIKNANQSGGVDEAVLQQARDDYSKAEAYFHATVGDAPMGVKVVHNPVATENYCAQVGNLLDGIIASLG